MTEELIPVNMVIADRSYRLKINASDEETIRRSIKTINEKIIEYKANFSGKDMQDYVSMVLLWFATEQQKPVNLSELSAESTQEIIKMDELLDKALSTV